MRRMPFRFDNTALPDVTREYRLALFCVGSVSLLVLAGYFFNLYDLWLSYRQDFLGYYLIDRDFSNYWLGARFIMSGDHLDLFSQATYFPRMRETFGPYTPWRNWGYPPHYFFFIWWLAPLSYKVGLAAFLGGTFALFIFAAAVFRRVYAPDSDARLLWLAVFGYSVMQVITSQNGFLTSAFLLLGLAWMRHRPVLAGLSFACLTVKPQLGLLIPMLLVFDRNWAAFAWSAVFTLVLVAVSGCLFGFDSWSAYLNQTMPYQRWVMMEGDGIFPFMMPTAFASMRAWGFPADVALLAQVPVTAAALAGVIWLLCHERDPLRRSFTVTCGTFLISPYGFNYDMGALSVCAALLVAERFGQARGSFFTSSIALVAAIAGAVTHIGRMGLPFLTPLVLATSLVVLIAAARHAQRGEVGAQARAPLHA